MKVTCKVIQDLLPLYHDGVASPDTAALVEEHLKDCEACQEVYHKLQESPSAPLPSPILPKREQVLAGLQRVRKAIKWKWVRAAAIAVTATLLAVVLFFVAITNIWIISPVEEAVQSVEYHDVGAITVNVNSVLSGLPMLSAIPATDDGTPDGEPILVVTQEYRISEWMGSLNNDEPEALVFPVIHFDWPLTEEGWYSFYGEQRERELAELEEWYRLHPEDYTEEGYQSSLEVIAAPSHQLPWGDIQKVYYYDAHLPDTAIERTRNQYGFLAYPVALGDTPEEVQQNLDKHGTLLWTAEDGVVYNP